MTLPEILLLALALAVDAFTVGTAVGLRHHSPRQVFRLSFHFGLFQALMPLVGIGLGYVFEELIDAFDHWVAFGLLLFVGGRMLLEAFRGRSADAEEGRDPTKGLSMVLLSVAVSIDALAVGFTLGLAGGEFILPVVVIGVVAGALTVLGMFLGGRVGSRFGRGATLFAGLVLIGIGVKVLVAGLS